MLSEFSAPLKIFISYSRRDLRIADSFVTELEAQNFEVVIDRRSLPYGEEWQKELADFIRSSDTVLWLISEASLASKWVRWELGEVERLKKRLVPVRIANIDPDTLPELLQKIHALPAEAVFDFSLHLLLLTRTLNTNVAWLKEATRLSDRARQWKAKDQDEAQLLRGRGTLRCRSLGNGEAFIGSGDRQRNPRFAAAQPARRFPPSTAHCRCCPSFSQLAASAWPSMPGNSETPP